MRRLDPRSFVTPFNLGILEWPAMITVLAALFAYLCKDFAPPSADLTRSVAEIAATLFIGWVVEAVWMTLRLEHEGEDRESWLGGIAGVGLGGVFAVTAALLVSAHREAGHANYLDWFGLWWATLATFFLGALLAMHPVIVDRWAPKEKDRSTNETGTTAHQRSHQGRRLR